MTRAATYIPSVLFTLLVACDSTGPVLTTVVEGDVGDVGLDVAMDADDERDLGDDDGTGDDVGQAMFCESTGPVAFAGGECSANLTGFSRALCLCNDLSHNGALTTRRIRGGTASVAVDGVFDPGLVNLAGHLSLASPTGVALQEPATVESLSLAGRLGSSSDVSVATDAEVGGDIQIAGDLTVGGLLTSPSGNVVEVAGTESIAQQRRASVSVSPACSCGGVATITRWIDAAATSNDNDSIDLDPRELNPSDGTTLTLPCGRYYLDGIVASTNMSIEIVGRVALFIRGDLSLERAMSIELGPDSELDLFLGGSIVAPQSLSIGAPGRPEALRIYAASPSTLAVAGLFSLWGFLYAPRAELVLSAGAEVEGGMVLRRVSASGDITIDHPDVQLTCE